MNIGNMHPNHPTPQGGRGGGRKRRTPMDPHPTSHPQGGGGGPYHGGGGAGLAHILRDTLNDSYIYLHVNHEGVP